MPEQPKDPREEDIHAGDRRISRPDSSLPDWEVPDTAYRPIPIVWFAGAMILQWVVLTGLFFLLINQPSWMTVFAAALVTGMIGKWTWDRGMAGAGNIWRAATIAVLTANLLLVLIAVSDRF